MKNNLSTAIAAILIIAAMYFSFKYFNSLDKPDNKNPDQQSQEQTQANSTTTNNNINTTSNNPKMDQSQLKIETIKEGTGTETKNGDKLKVHYTGTLENGQKFDSSLDRGIPFEFVLGQGMVIRGWEQGMLGMKAGEKRKLFIPYQLAYGESGYGPIPAKTNLIFEVELLQIN